MNNFYYRPQYVPGAPQKPFQAVNNLPLNSPQYGYNSVLQYPTGPPPAIGFNLPSGPSQNIPNASYAAGYNGVTNACSGWYGAPNMSSGGYDSYYNISTGWSSSPLNVNNNSYSPYPNWGYGIPPNVPNSIYGVPPNVPNSDYGSPPNISSGGCSDPPAVPARSYPACPTAPPIGSVTDPKTIHDFNNPVNSTAESNIGASYRDSEFNLSQRPSVKLSNDLTTDKHKSDEYQRGLDRLALLMNEDINLSENLLRKVRAKYDLTSS